MFVTRPRITKKDYSPGMMVPNLSAPAAIQNLASHLIKLSKIGGGMLLWRNTRTFLSFQTDQLMSIVRCHGLLIGSGDARTVYPPILDGSLRVSSGGVDVL